MYANRGRRGFIIPWPPSVVCFTRREQRTGGAWELWSLGGGKAVVTHVPGHGYERLWCVGDGGCADEAMCCWLAVLELSSASLGR